MDQLSQNGASPTKVEKKSSKALREGPKGKGKGKGGSVDKIKSKGKSKGKGKTKSRTKGAAPTSKGKGKGKGSGKGERRQDRQMPLVDTGLLAHNSFEAASDGLSEGQRMALLELSDENVPYVSDHVPRSLRKPLLSEFVCSASTGLPQQ